MYGSRYSTAASIESPYFTWRASWIHWCVSLVGLSLMLKTSKSLLLIQGGRCRARFVLAIDDSANCCWISSNGVSKSFCFSTDLYFVLLLSFNEANNFSIDYVTSTDEKITTEPHDLYFWGIRQNYSLSRIYTTGTVYELRATPYNSKFQYWLMIQSCDIWLFYSVVYENKQKTDKQSRWNNSQRNC